MLELWMGRLGIGGEGLVGLTWIGISGRNDSMATVHRPRLRRHPSLRDRWGGSSSPLRHCRPR